MLGQIVAFLAVATSIAFANSCGFCYPGYGTYVNSVPVLRSGPSNSDFYRQRVLSSSAATPVIASKIYSAPAFSAPVGAPEVMSSCENSIGSPVVPFGLYKTESALGGYRTAVLETVC